MKQFYLINSMCALLLLLMSCSAPRNNPLDPENPDSKYGVFQGTVSTYSIPQEPLVNAYLFQGGTIIGKTDNTGNYHIDMAVPTDGWVSIQCDGYRIDSTYIHWDNSKKISHDFLLYQIPKADSIIFYSVFRRTFTGSFSEMTMQVGLTDKDNDIESVFFQRPNDTSKYNLGIISSGKSYDITVTPDSLSLASIDEAVGTEYPVYAKEKLRQPVLLGKAVIKRVISEQVIGLSPSGNEATSARPTLQWEDFNAAYTVTRTIQVYKNGGDVATLVWEKKGLAASETSITVDKDLGSGSYFWVIWVVDSFLNRARSVQYSFQVN